MRARSRPLYAALLIITVIAGLSSRRYAVYLPSSLQKNAGDILYATMAFFLTAFLFPRLTTLRALAVAIVFCWMIEFQQMIQWPPLVALRNTRPGGLILGHGFHILDLADYILGALLGATVDVALHKGPIKTK
jgi:hypothetical protein